MPRLSDSMEEGTVVRWLKENGELVRRGEELVEIETDKATMIYEAEATGVLRQLVAEGNTVALGTAIAELLGEEASASQPARDAERPFVVPERVTSAPSPANGASSSRPPSAGAPRVPASPVARRLAALHGLDLAGIEGTGPRGQVVKRDVEAALAVEGTPTSPRREDVESGQVQAEPPSPPAVSTSSDGRGAKGAVDVRELSRVQMTIARRMAESRATVPDIAVEIDVDADALVELRRELRERLSEGPVPSYNDFVVKACGLALREHSRVNGSYHDGHLEHYSRVNVGIAVAADEALLVPVVEDADMKSVGAIARESRALAERARTGALTPPELSGGTFTVSNLGMFGVTRFSAVINMPQSAILAVGALRREPVVRGDEVRPGHVMSLTLCADHRTIYGADAARFLSDVRAHLEEPLRLLV
ncbi:MAG: 2-oxo acid dehydrogenase subunit E2 [Solirubrobacterales bacterium]|nr:2-oxo acid dehydrogenase subunit E2 [Solirubrobacterales bacterium]